MKITRGIGGMSWWWCGTARCECKCELDSRGVVGALPILARMATQEWLNLPSTWLKGNQRIRTWLEGNQRDRGGEQRCGQTPSASAARGGAPGVRGPGT